MPRPSRTTSSERLGCRASATSGWAAVDMARRVLIAAVLPCLCGSFRSTAWRKVWIAPKGWGLSHLMHRRPGWSIAAAAVHAAEAVICMPNAASQDEIDRLLGIGSSLAEQVRTGSDGVRQLDEKDAVSSGVRLHIPTKLPSEQALVDTIMQRVLKFVDTELSSLGPCLFGVDALSAGKARSLCALHSNGNLEFSPNEPAVNVYYSGGGFSPHRDYCALTVLIPLSSPADGSFTGGGTGFWAPGSRHGQDSAAPSITLAPPAGTALLFAGDVLHAGLPVESGKRVVLVASFDRKFDDEQSL